MISRLPFRIAWNTTSRPSGEIAGLKLASAPLVSRSGSPPATGCRQMADTPLRSESK